MNPIPPAPKGLEVSILRWLQVFVNSRFVPLELIHSPGLFYLESCRYALWACSKAETPYLPFPAHTDNFLFLLKLPWRRRFLFC
jgi:hypothetical protein